MKSFIMDKVDGLLKEMEVNKALFNSTLTTPAEKMNAFRKQSIILDEITKSTSEPQMLSAFGSQINALKYSNNYSYNDFIEERNKNLEILIRRHGPSALSEIASPDGDFLKGSKSFLECWDKYKSCAKNEVRAEDLKMFKNIFGEIPAKGVMETPSNRQPWSDDSKIEIENPMAKKSQLKLNSFVMKNPYAGKMPSFRTARDEYIIQTMKKKGDSVSASSSRTLFNYGASKKSLGARRNVRSDFVPPIRQDESASLTNVSPDAMDASSTEPVDERLRNIDPKMIELITNEIMHKYTPIGWNDIAGLQYAKSTIKEAVVWPLLRPDIFTGLRRPPRGILLFGPPGTGKTLIGKCIASQVKATFFSISASSLTSKWVGDGEKMVRALFAVASVHQPSVVFIDEIDSLLSQRSNSEHESSRRLKTEFLVQLDGTNTVDEDKILIIGATNRPQELDEAARRRLVRRLYIPLPELPARIQILRNLLQTVRNTITEEEIVEIGNLTDRYSGADMETLCREASMEPIRSIPPEEIPIFDEENVRAVTFDDFRSALETVRASVSGQDLKQYVDWNNTYGAGQ